jgi:hypothetical protein
MWSCLSKAVNNIRAELTDIHTRSDGFSPFSEVGLVVGGLPEGAGLRYLSPGVTGISLYKCSAL